MHLRFVFLFLFPVITCAQTFSEGRFIARNNTLLWTEKFEIKDMDEPIILETVKEQLSAKEGIRFDKLQQHEVLTGQLIYPPSSSIAGAGFRVDILYERYIVTVSEIVEKTPTGEIKIEKSLLNSGGRFGKYSSQRLDTLDRLFMAIFEIKQ